MRTLVKILIAVIAFFVITGVFVKQVRIAGGRARMALEKEQDAAREVCETIAGLCKDAERMVKESEDRLDTATNALEFVVGSTDLGGLELIVREEEPEVEEEEAVKSSSPAPKQRRKPRAAAGRARKKKKKGFFPEGIMSPEELARRKAVEAGREASRSSKPEKKAAVTPERSVAPVPRETAAPVPKGPDIQSVVRGMWRKTAQLRDRAEALRDVEANALKIKAVVLGSERAETAATRGRPLPKRLEAAQAVADEAQVLYEEIQEASVEVKSIRKQVTADRRKAKAEERRRKEEERRAAHKERERQLVELVRQEGHKMVLEHRYSEAEDMARARHKQLATGEARNGMAVLADRFSSMKDLKAFLVSRMAAAKYEWGWGFGQQAVDIIGATDKEIQLQGKRVRWSQVSTAQMLKFINYYVETVKMRPSLRAKRCLEAAVYCDEIAQAEKADTYRGRSVDLNPAMRSRLKRLLGK